jgi:hypothetical protein
MRMLLAALVCCSVPASPAAAQTPPPDTVYTSIKPCRAFNTATSAKITGNNYKTFQVGGPGSLVSQGGPAAGCGVPATATAVAISLTGIAPASTGYASAFAYGAQLPNTYTVQVSTAVPATAGATVAVAEGKVNVFVSKTMHVIGDVTGYYAPQIRAVFNPNGSINSSSKRILSIEKVSTGNYRVKIDRNVDECTSIASIYGGFYLASSYTSGTSVYAATYKLDGTLADLYWTLVVLC